MGFFTEQQKQDFDGAMKEAVSELDVVKWQAHQDILDSIRQEIADVTGIPASLLKKVTVVTQEAVASPDLGISVGDFQEHIPDGFVQINGVTTGMRPHELGEGQVFALGDIGVEDFQAEVPDKPGRSKLAYDKTKRTIVDVAARAATTPLSRAIDATRTQFEAPSLKMVNADPWTPKQS